VRSRDSTRQDAPSSNVEHVLGSMHDNDVFQHYPAHPAASHRVLRVTQQLYLAGGPGARGTWGRGGPFMHMFRSALDIAPALHPEIVPLSALAMDCVWSCDLAVSGRHRTGLCDMCWTQDGNGVVHTRDDLLHTRDDLPADQNGQTSCATTQPSRAARSNPPGQTLSDLFRPLGPTDPYAPISCDTMANADTIDVNDAPQQWVTRSGRISSHLLVPDQPVQTWWADEASPLTHTADIDATVQCTHDQSEAVASDAQ